MDFILLEPMKQMGRSQNRGAGGKSGGQMCWYEVVVRVA